MVSNTERAANKITEDEPVSSDVQQAEQAGKEGLQEDQPLGQQQEAYNAETGEINWDCPCLGPMVQPPCGDKFKEAFSCFVYSKEEPKGSECIAQFREMQLCFQAHPEIYGADMEEDDDDANVKDLDGPVKDEIPGQEKDKRD